MFGLRRTTPEEIKLLGEIKDRLKADQDKAEHERQLYDLLVNSELDFDTLARIGKRVGADSIEIINKNGAIVRYYFNARTQPISEAERAAIDEGVW